jgi:hypothetical protein
MGKNRGDEERDVQRKGQVESRGKYEYKGNRVKHRKRKNAAGFCFQN